MERLVKLTNAKTRSISPENFTGEKGKACTATEGTGKDAARELGKGWKVSPSVRIDPGQTFTMAEINGPALITQIWLTPSQEYDLRNMIIRIYWDDEENPSVETPVGDFFAAPLREHGQISSLAVCVNPGNGMNCYWQMPFRKRCKITFTNLNPVETVLYYQVNYELREITEETPYFHCRFRRTNPVEYKQDYIIVDDIQGRGHFVGTHMLWGVNNNGWWGEGEVKFYIDGDDEYPTIAYTGTEDYFCGSYCYTDPDTGKYKTYTTPYCGVPLISNTDEVYKAVRRFSMYRWHITDPIRFERNLRVTCQVLGWRSEGRYLPRRDDISSTAYWYQLEPHKNFPPLPDKDELELI